MKKQFIAAAIGLGLAVLTSSAFAAGPAHPGVGPHPAMHGPMGHPGAGRPGLGRRGGGFERRNFAHRDFGRPGYGRR